MSENILSPQHFVSAEHPPMSCATLDFDSLWQTSAVKEIDADGVHVLNTTLNINGDLRLVTVKKHIAINLNEKWAWLLRFYQPSPLLKAYRNIKRLQHCHIATDNLIKFEQRDNRTVLVTHTTDTFTPFSKLNWSSLAASQRITILNAIARELVNLHLHRFQHGDCQPDNIGIKQVDQHIEVKLTGVNQLRWTPFISQATRRDLRDFLRQTAKLISLEEQEQFLAAYYDYFESA